MISSLKIGDRLEIETESLSRGGRAVGRASGQVVFVEGGAPGERVLVEITKLAKRFAEARIVEVLRPSSHRRAPPCPYFLQCGGCPWQHIDYSEQVAQKRKILVETLVRGGAIFDVQTELPREAPFVASPIEWRYRSRITLHTRHGKVGFMKRSSHDFVAIDDCLIAAEGLVPFGLESLDRAKDQRIQVTKSDDKLRIGSGFTQVHLEQNSKLQSRVVELVLQSPAVVALLDAHTQQKLNENDQKLRILDLYAGNGNFSYPIESALRDRLDFELTAVELSPDSIADAEREKAQRSSKIDFVRSDVGHWLGKFGSTSTGFREVVVLDPPRVGCEENVIEALARRKPSSLIYVSCDPTTLARDIKRLRTLTAEAGQSYAVRVFQGYDLFPQTDHIEAIIVLDRTD